MFYKLELLSVIIVFTLLYKFHLTYSPVPTVLPTTLPQISIDFIPDLDLHPFTPVTQKFWANLIPRNWNHAVVRNVNGDLISQGLEVYHRLHCLTALREQITAFVVEGTDARARFDQDESETQRLHLGHCLDLLRQGFICHADITLEPLDENFQETGGWGVQHQCSDLSLLDVLMNRE